MGSGSVKFNQLAELRNGIRDSRTVDEVTRKEGEAATLWFEQCLRGIKQADQAAALRASVGVAMGRPA